MKHIIRLTAFIALAIISLYASAKDTYVWDFPIYGYSTSRYTLNIEKVEFTPDSTVLSVRIKYPKGGSNQFIRQNLSENRRTTVSDKGSHRN